MLKNGTNDLHGNLKNAGCSCCNSKQDRRAAKKSAKAKEARAWKKENQDD